MKDFRDLLREFPDLSYDEILEIDRLRNAGAITEQHKKLRELRDRETRKNRQKLISQGARFATSEDLKDL